MPTVGVFAPKAAFQPTSGTSGSWMWITSKSSPPTSRRVFATPPQGDEERFETAPLAPKARVRPSGMKFSGSDGGAAAAR